MKVPFAFTGGCERKSRYDVPDRRFRDYRAVRNSRWICELLGNEPDHNENRHDRG